MTGGTALARECKGVCKSTIRSVLPDFFPPLQQQQGASMKGQLLTILEDDHSRLRLCMVLKMLCMPFKVCYCGGVPCCGCSVPWAVVPHAFTVSHCCVDIPGPLHHPMRGWRRVRASGGCAPLPFGSSPPAPQEDPRTQCRSGLPRCSSLPPRSGLPPHSCVPPRSRLPPRSGLAFQPRPQHATQPQK
jgi:hypothetical protein